jgi:hypothetical protein
LPLGGTLSLTNSTVSRNWFIAMQNVFGGAIYGDQGSVKLLNTTVVNNTPYSAIYLNSGKAALQNTIITQAASGPACAGPSPISSVFTSRGFNIVNHKPWMAQPNPCGLGPSDLTTDPKLLPLAINTPGTTATHALEPGSPARDAIPFSNPNGSPGTDQRRVIRPQPSGNADYDIGAYEY